MAKIKVCDVCLKDKVLSESTGTMSIKGQGLSVDYCDKCKVTIPREIPLFVQFCYSLMGVDISEKKAKELLSK